MQWDQILIDKFRFQVSGLDGANQDQKPTATYVGRYHGGSVQSNTLLLGSTQTLESALPLFDHDFDPVILWHLLPHLSLEQ